MRLLNRDTGCVMSEVIVDSTGTYKTGRRKLSPGEVSYYTLPPLEPVEPDALSEKERKFAWEAWLASGEVVKEGDDYFRVFRADLTPQCMSPDAIPVPQVSEMEAITARLARSCIPSTEAAFLVDLSRGGYYDYMPGTNDDAWPLVPTDVGPTNRGFANQGLDVSDAGINEPQARSGDEVAFPSASATKGITTVKAEEAVESWTSYVRALAKEAVDSKRIGCSLHEITTAIDDVRALLEQKSDISDRRIATLSEEIANLVIGKFLDGKCGKTRRVSAGLTTAINKTYPHRTRAELEAWACGEAGRIMELRIKAQDAVREEAAMKHWTKRVEDSLLKAEGDAE
jgi:hypothetical protein